jgi:hypothetical protein
MISATPTLQTQESPSRTALYEHAVNAVNAKVVGEIADYLLDFAKR